MKKLLLISAALGMLSGSAWAQMQGGQDMDQQMQNMQRQNPRMNEQAPDQSTAPDQRTNPDQRQGTTVQRRGTMTSRVHVATPTKVLSGDQKARIEKTVIQSGRAPRMDNLNFTVRVGAPIPRNVQLVPVPQEILAIYPEWSGFLYFVSGDEIIVVDPNSYAVVGVLEA
jgi:hypothetical protein